MKASRSLGQLYAVQTKVRSGQMPCRPKSGLPQVSRQQLSATPDVWQSVDEFDRGLDHDILIQAESDMGSEKSNSLRACAALADRRANVLCSFLQGQNDWLFTMAQEMRQRVLSAAREQGDNEEMVRIPWRRWAEFSTGVVEQTQRAQRMLRSQAAVFKNSIKASDLEQNCSQLETLLARYEMQNVKLLQDLGHQQKWDLDGPSFDTAATEKLPAGNERRCLCANGCRCLSGSRLDPVQTVSHGWLKNDDVRLHRRIISEQRLLVERQSRYCFEQESALEKLHHRVADCQQELEQKSQENDELKAGRVRLQQMLRQKIESLQDLRVEADASDKKVQELSAYIEKQRNETSLGVTLKLFKYERLKAASTIQRIFRDKKEERLELLVKAVLPVQKAVRKWLQKKGLQQKRSCVPSSPDSFDMLSPSFSSGKAVDGTSFALLRWESELENEKMAEVVQLLNTLQEIELQENQFLQVGFLEQSMAQTSEGDSLREAEPEPGTASQHESQAIILDDIMQLGVSLDALIE